VQTYLVFNCKYIYI